MSPTATASHSPAPAQRSTRTNLRACWELNREWDTTLDSPAHDTLVADWGREDLLSTCAGGVRTLRELERICRDVQGEDSDAVLLVLLGLHQTGAPLAGRLLLQLFLGKIVVLATPKVTQGVSVHEHEANALSAFWSVISTYPCSRRRRRVGANLAMDTLNGVYGRAVAKERPQAVFHLSEHGQHSHTDRPSQDPTAAVLLLIHDGLAARAISIDDAQLLVATYAPDSAPVTSAHLAKRLGLSAPALRQRTSRAVGRLSAFVHRAVIEQSHRARPVLVEEQRALPAWVTDEELLVLMNALAPCA